MSKNPCLAALVLSLPLTALACGDSFQATGAGGSGAGGQSGPGGPGGSGGSGGSGGATTGSASCEADIQVKPASAYKMAKYDGDAVVCYGMDVPLKKKRHIVRIAPKIGNTNIVHFVRLWDSAAPYGPDPVSACGDPQKGRLLAAWAPGGGAVDLPEEAGFPIDGTVHFMVEIHYSNLQHMDGQEDESGFGLCTTETLRPYDADILAFGTFGINVPAMGTSDVTCDVTNPPTSGTYTVFSAMPHMHQKGRRLVTTLLPAGGGAGIDLGTADPFAFGAQKWGAVDKVPVKPNDKIRTRCAWANDTDKDAHYGQNTADEQCFDFVMYYPRIQDATWSWGAPAFFASCMQTPSK
jgi:hypothetical protein